MHGRVKVRTTAEQQEAKRKEREKKLKTYQAIHAKIFEKRANKEYDDEILELTEKILTSDPDVTTLWNIRREAIEQRDDNSEHVTIAKHERRLTETCLGVNPKSYCAWLHRKWIMMTYANEKEEWDEEIRLCDVFLKYDERNFHCWDYRRFVVSKAGIEFEKEFEFSMKKIMDNISNYSGWHYRSKLLPLVRPDPENKERPAESALLKEYELVQNAVFTDPYDQSAWFYHRWLLGRVESPLIVSCVLAEKRDNDLLVHVSLTKPVDVFSSVVLTIDGVECPVEWTSSASFIWQARVDAKTAKEIIVRAEFSAKQEIEVTFTSDEETLGYGLCDSLQLFRRKKTQSADAVLTSELESCQQLLELEPGNKWTLLTLVFLMEAIDPIGHKDTIVAHLVDLISVVDPCRRGYYQDLKSRFVIERVVESMFRSFRNPILDLKDHGLSRLYHMHHVSFVTELDVSNNCLSSLSGCQHLLNLSVLIADENQIAEISSSLARLSRLVRLSLNHNKISSIESLSGLKGMKLGYLSLCHNPLRSIEDVKTVLRTRFPLLTLEL